MSLENYDWQFLDHSTTTYKLSQGRERQHTMIGRGNRSCKSAAWVRNGKNYVKLSNHSAIHFKLKYDCLRIWHGDHRERQKYNVTVIWFRYCCEKMANWSDRTALKQITNKIGMTLLEHGNILCSVQCLQINVVLYALTQTRSFL